MRYTLFLLLIMPAISYASSPSWVVIEDLFERSASAASRVLEGKALYQNQAAHPSGWKVISYKYENQIKDTYFGNHSTAFTSDNLTWNCIRNVTVQIAQGFIHHRHRMVIQRDNPGLALISQDLYETSEELQ